MTSINCPYRGLHVFRKEDARYFFGRESDSHRLSQTVQREPLVALVGPSATGKLGAVNKRGAPI